MAATVRMMGVVFMAPLPGRDIDSSTLVTLRERDIGKNSLSSAR
jgi:hypothetical protein